MIKLFKHKFGNFVPIFCGLCLHTLDISEIGVVINLLIYLGCFVVYLAFVLKEVWDFASPAYVFFTVLLFLLYINLISSNYNRILYSICATTFYEPGIVPPNKIESESNIDEDSEMSTYNHSGSTEFIKLKVDIRYNRLKSLQEDLSESKEHLCDVDSEGRSLLHFAIFDSKMDICELLISNGLLPNVRDSYNLSPLHYAALNKRIETFKELIKICKDCNIDRDEFLIDIYVQSDEDVRIAYMNDIITILGPDQRDANYEQLVTYQSLPPKDNLHKKLAILYNGDVKLINSCKVCRIYPPPRSHHCSICNACIMKFDHHCPWMGNCIGLRNYRFFVFFLLFTVILSIFIFASFIHTFLEKYNHYKNSNNDQSALTSTLDDLIGFIAIVVIFILLDLMLSNLVYFHIRFVMENKTTYDYFSARQESFSLGVWNNIKTILFSPIPKSKVLFQ